jgi:hypothetical protein
MRDGSFKPGEKVPTTGIYTATHYQHRLPHDVFAVEGDRFPVCRKCGDAMRFALVQSAHHVDLDRDFSQAAGNSKPKKAKSGEKRKPQ